MFSCNVGILISFVVGHYVQYTMRPVVLLLFPIAFLLLFFRFPETPAFLMRAGREDEAERSLRFYRNDAMPASEDEKSAAAGPMLKVEMEELRQSNRPAGEKNEVAEGTAESPGIEWGEFGKTHF